MIMYCFYIQNRNFKIPKDYFYWLLLFLMISFINLTKYLIASKIEKSSYGYYRKSNLFLKVFTMFWIAVHRP